MEPRPQNTIRQDAVTGQWVIVAPDRGKRPHSVSSDSPKASHVTPENCPFCPGHEDQIPPIIEETTDGGDSWLTRVFPNKYPALTEDASAPASHDFFAARAATGRHEVIVETPDHCGDLPDRSMEAVEALMRTYRNRFQALRNEDDRLIPYVFRNHGARAGASQPHPHSQIVAPTVVPRSLDAQERRLRDHHDEYGRCLVCEQVEQEVAEGERVVASNDAFLAVVPFAALVPYEIRLLPRRHAPDFGATPDREIIALADLLREALRRLRSVLGSVPYNYVIQPTTTFREDAAHAHWYLLIRPRGSGGGGFERASDMMINTSLPEDDAAALRNA